MWRRKAKRELEDELAAVKTYLNEAKRVAAQAESDLAGEVLRGQSREVRLRQAWDENTQLAGQLRRALHQLELRIDMPRPEVEPGDPSCPVCRHERDHHDGWGCKDCTCLLALVFQIEPVGVPA